MVQAYTHFNLGDDLFIKILCDKYPKTTFVLSAPKQYKDCFKNINNLQIIPNDSLIMRGLNYIIKKLGINFRLIQLIPSKYDATVLIGGSLFIQNDHWKKDFDHKLALGVKRKPSFLLGANFGPFVDHAFYLEYRKYFKRYTDICFRDQYSYNLFKDLPQVRIASDIVFQLPRPKKTSDERSIVISVIKPSIRRHLANKDAIYYQKIKEIVIQFIEKGYTVTLMSFCEFERDHEAVNTIANSLPIKYKPKLKKYYYQGDLQDALETISRSSFVVATRFHAMILGWIYEKPVFPIVYSEKMKHVMEDINYTGSYTDFNMLKELEATEVFSSMHKNLVDVTSQIKHSKNHFNKLDEYLLRDEKG